MHIGAMSTESRAPFATYWERSRGRAVAEPPSATRTPFQRDRDRLVHCTAFRRLMHKTQVFIAPEVDHVRTRLTHSLEVAQIARSIARTLRLDEDLTEVVALSHDLGHPPFGHTGEDALDEAMGPFGGFDHNDQALRVVTRLERRYPGFAGLNLTWETLEGLVKHNGPLLGSLADPKHGAASPEGLPATIREVTAGFDLELDRFAGPEAQVAALSDDIAYNHHDLDDGLRARLFTIDEACDAVPDLAVAFAAARADFPGIERQVLIAEVVRRLIGAMVDDLLVETRRRLEEDRIETVDDVYANTRPVVALSAQMQGVERRLKAFLYGRMYRNPQVNQERAEAKRIVAGLFRHFLWTPDALPEEWRRGCDGPGGGWTARIVADYIAGMTDRYAKREFRLTLGVATVL